MARFKDASDVVDELMGQSSAVEDWGDCGVLYTHQNHPGVLYRIGEDVGYTRRLILDYVMSVDRYQGNASRFMQYLCELADEHFLQIDLQAAAFSTHDALYGESLDQGDLVAWYESFDFAEEVNEEQGRGYWMRRNPQQ